MIGRLFILMGMAVLPATPSLAQENLFELGTVLCSNYDERTRTCRTITTVTTLDDDLRYARTRRMVAMPDENLLLETQGVDRVEGNRVCGIGPTGEPRVSPDHYSYTSVLLAVYKDKRDKKIARGVCHEYRRCGAGWHVYITYDDQPEPRLVSFTTMFGPEDPRRFGLSLRYREFGVNERTPSDCPPAG